VSGTIYFLWHTRQQAAYGQREADNGADNRGQRSGQKVVTRIHATGIVMQTSRDVDSRKPFLAVMLNQGSAKGDTGETGIVMQT
jgi:hypothetical protein